jgi:PEP-CTERM motif-containing protein
MFLARLVAVAALVAGLAAPANALTISVPGGGTVDVPDGTGHKEVCDGNGTCQVLFTAGTTSFGGASAGLGVPFASVSASDAGAGQLVPGADAVFDISFVWIGPTGAAGSLPVNITLNMSTFAFGTDPNASVNARASFKLTNSNPGDLGTGFDGMNLACNEGLLTECFNNGADGTGQFSGTLNFNLTPDFVYTYEIEAGAGGGTNDGSQWNSSASVDPLISLDSSFGNIGGYTLYLSMGFENGFAPVNPPSGVPEPGTLVILTSGLIGLGLARRRKARERTV